jgi:hypothetical protein
MRSDLLGAIHVARVVSYSISCEFRPVDSPLMAARIISVTQQLHLRPAYKLDRLIACLSLLS